MCFLWKGSDYHGQKSKTSIKEKRKGWCKEASEAYIRIALYTETPAYVGCTWQVFFVPIIRNKLPVVWSVACCEIRQDVG